MGLDNGIQIRRNKVAMSIYDKIKCFEQEWAKPYEYDFEICYWRKCYNIRSLIFNCIGSCNNDGEIPIQREDIPKIIEILKSLNSKNWEDEGSSIWTYEEQKPHIKQQIKNLKRVYRLMDKYDLEVYFYDSY